MNLHILFILETFISRIYVDLPILCSIVILLIVLYNLNSVKKIDKKFLNILNLLHFILNLNIVRRQNIYFLRGLFILLKKN